METRELSIGC